MIETDEQQRKSILKRLKTVERRQSRLGAPSTITGAGRAVTNWNNATAVGFYWGNGATNAPVAGIVFGIVESDGTRIVQTVHDPSMLMTRIWRRVYSSGSWGSWKIVSSADLPDPLSQVLDGSTSTTVTGTAWMDISGMAGVTFGALPQDMYCRAEFSAQVVGNASAYTMIGPHLSGAVTLEAQQGQAWQGSGTAQFGWAPFTQSTTATAIGGSKDFLLPAGASVTIKLRCKRNVATGTNTVSYPRLEVMPIRWA